MVWIGILIAVLFTVIGAVCVVSVLFGLPGVWVILGLAVVIEMTDTWYLPENEGQTFNWWLLGACLLLALLGEVMEFFSGVLGSRKAGGSKRGMVGSLIGGLVGGILGFFVPVPGGSLTGIVIGTFGGAVLGELSGNQRPEFRDTLKPAAGATLGRILGTLSKLPIALVVWVMLATAAFWL